MKFTLIQLLILMLPVAILALLVSDLLKSQDIEWRKFSLTDFERTRKEKIPALILCRPDMFAASNWGRLDEKKLHYNSSTPFVAYRHDYRYWTSSQMRDQRSQEDKWMLDNGGNKEPLLILVSGGGERKSLNGLRFDSPDVTEEIIEFLDIAKQRQSRITMLLWLFALSLVATVALTIGWLRKSVIVG